MNTLKSILCTILMIALTITVFSSEAGKSEGDLEYFYLGEIYVIGEKEFDNRDVVKAEDLTEMNPNTLEEIIQLSPGIDVSVGQKNSYELTLRGISQDKISVNLDGIPIYEPYYYDTDLSFISLPGISRLSISKGYASAEYGANTLGGAINIITASPDSENMIKFRGGFGNNSTIFSDVLFTKEVNKFGFTIGANYGKSDGYSLSKDYEETINEDGNLRENSDYDKLGTLVRVNYKPLENINLALSNYLIDSEKGLPYDEEAERSYHRYFREPRYWRFSEYKKNINAFDVNYLTDLFELKGKLFHIKTDNTLDMYMTDEFEELGESDTFDDYTLGHKLGFIFYTEKDSEFTFGFNYKKDYHKKIANSFFYDEIEIDEISQEIYTLYAENRSFFFDRKVYIQLGMNYDTLASDGYKTYMQGDTDVLTIAGENIESYNPNLLVAWNFYETFNLGFSIQKKTHYPGMNQVANNLDLGLDITELKPEESVNKEVFVKSEWEKYSLKVSAFNYKIKDMIERDGKGDPYFNLQSARIIGQELLVTGQPLEKFGFSLGMSFLNTESTTPDGNPGDYLEELQFVPSTSYVVSLKSDYFLTTRLNIRYQSGAYEYYENEDWEMVKDEIPAFTLIDLKLEKTILEHYSAFVIVENLLDIDYYQESYFPAPGMSWQAGVTVEF